MYFDLPDHLFTFLALNDILSSLHAHSILYFTKLATNQIRSTKFSEFWGRGYSDYLSTGPLFKYSATADKIVLYEERYAKSDS